MKKLQRNSSYSDVFGSTISLVSIMIDRQSAEMIQLGLEYNPAPPFNSGSPDTAPPDILALMKEKIAPFRQRRNEATARAAARLA
jgi:cyclohexyl-isocyanide hydratase